MPTLGRMALYEEIRDGLGIALNESRWLDVRVDGRRAEVRFLLQVLTLPEAGPEPSDTRRVIRCWGVSRLIASLRDAPLRDHDAPAAGLELRDLPAALRSFGALPVYGWRFVDPPSSWIERWEHRLSLDERFAETTADEHRLYLFQDGADRCLEICVVFGDMSVTDHKGRQLSLERFVGDARRWWEALSAGDPRVQGHGIVPVSRD